jgi:cell division protein FtsL
MSKATTRSSDRVLWMDGKQKVRSEFRKSRLFVAAFLTFLVIVSALFYVWSRIKVIQVGYEISNSLKEGRMLEETNKKLRLEIATLKSYARLEKIAVEELRMSKPKSDQVIIIR